MWCQAHVNLCLHSSGLWSCLLLYFACCPGYSLLCSCNHKHFGYLNSFRMHVTCRSPRSPIDHTSPGNSEIDFLSVFLIPRLQHLYHKIFTWADLPKLVNPGFCAQLQYLHCNTPHIVWVYYMILLHFKTSFLNKSASQAHKNGVRSVTSWESQSGPLATCYEHRVMQWNATTNDSSHSFHGWKWKWSQTALREKRVLFVGPEGSDFKYILVIIQRDVAISQKLANSYLWWVFLKQNKI